MNGEVHAEVQRVLRGDSERALVHAVDDDGLEVRIELPERAVRAVEDGRGYTLRLSWSLESTASIADARGSIQGQLTELPRQEEPASILPSRQERHASSLPVKRTPTEVDAAFMALMAGLRADPSTTAEGATPEPTLISTPSSSSSPSPGEASSSRATEDSTMQLASRLGLTQPMSSTAAQSDES